MAEMVSRNAGTSIPFTIDIISFPFLSAAGGHAAIDRKHRASDPGSLLGGEEEYGLGDVTRLAVAADRMEGVEGGQRLLDLLISHEGVVDRRLDHGGGHGVDANFV